MSGLGVPVTAWAAPSPAATNWSKAVATQVIWYSPDAEYLGTGTEIFVTAQTGGEAIVLN